ncbi:MAG: cation:proton antiporter [Thermodesulfobacteriota bacterium]|nr:cation:proton antiporter [Thermodesulfobacteriota bacterium]
MQTALLGDLIIVLSLSILVIFLFLRIKVPSIVGFLIIGILAGPHGFGLIDAAQHVEFLSELGVILLLFTIGIEFSLKNLLQIKRSVLLGGSLQVAFTMASIYALALYFGFSSGQALFMGMLVSLSSTAIVLKLLDERAETTLPYGRNALAILIFQDIIVVPMMILTPFLAGAYGIQMDAPYMALLKGLAFIVFIFLSYKWLIPQLLYQIARTRSRQLFLLSIMLICLGVAWLTSRLGLSLALGAFLAGLIISESEYSQEALGRILPFRDIFVSFFFISIGMLLDITVFIEHPFLIVSAAVAIICLKAFTGSLATLIMGYPLRTVIITGLALAQIGEFSFVLIETGLDHALLDEQTYQIFLVISLITMSLTPFIMNIAPAMANLTMRLPLPNRLKCGLRPQAMTVYAEDRISMDDHLIIIGYGLNGQNVSKAAKMARIPYIILEMNPDTVQAERLKGEPIYYGDATQEAILKHADIASARVAVIAIPDAAATRGITASVRRLSSKVHIITRTRLVKEVLPLYQLGADEVIPEEFETSIEIFSRALSKYLIPHNDIEHMISGLRADGYKMLRSFSGQTTTVFNLEHELPDFKITSLRIYPDSPMAGLTLNECELRKKHHVSIMAIRRGKKTIVNPGGEDRLNSGDEVIVSGQVDNIGQVLPLFRQTTNKKYPPG